jgi:hypothetical protein
MNFIGSGISITRRRKNVDIDLSGLCGAGGSDLTKLFAGSGITISPPDGFGNRTITNLISVKAASEGVIQYSNALSSDLEANNSFKLDVLGSVDLLLPKGLQLGSGLGTAEIKFSDGSTLDTRPPIFTEGLTAPTGPRAGDRWFDTDAGILYTAITNGPSIIWVQL